jgi:4-alpha-glucanotransferase
MEKDNLSWLRERTRHAATLYDRFRLDHVIGYFRMYVKHPGQKKGAFEPAVERDQVARGQRVLSVMKEEAGTSKIVAEDLGVIPPFAREALESLELPGYRVIPWEKDEGTGFRDPRAYPRVSVATCSTHDTAPIVSWFDELPPADREGLGKLAGFGEDAREPERSLALLRVLFESGSDLALTLAAEILGQPDRINTPGTVDDKNWTYRLPKTIEELESDAAVLARMDRIRELVHASGR